MNEIEGNIGNNTVISSRRDISIDFLSGILVSYMIYTHICQESRQTNSILYVFLDSVLFYFMPWFFYKSGIFYKHNTPYKGTLNKINERFVWPIIIFGFANLPFFLMSNFAYIQSDTNYVISFFKLTIYHLFIKGSPFGNAPLWFLISLVFIRLFCLIIKSDKLLLPISLVMLTISFLLWRYNIGPIRLLTAPLLGFCFFSAGYYLKKIQYQRIFFYVSVLLCVVLYFVYPYHISVRSNEIYKASLVSTSGGGILLQHFFLYAV